MIGRSRSSPTVGASSTTTTSDDSGQIEFSLKVIDFSIALQMPDQFIPIVRVPAGGCDPPFTMFHAVRFAGVFVDIEEVTGRRVADHQPIWDGLQGAPLCLGCSPALGDVLGPGDIGIIAIIGLGGLEGEQTPIVGFIRPEYACPHTTQAALPGQFLNDPEARFGIDPQVMNTRLQYLVFGPAIREFIVMNGAIEMNNGYANGTQFQEFQEAHPVLSHRLFRIFSISDELRYDEGFAVDLRSQSPGPTSQLTLSHCHRPR